MPAMMLAMTAAVLCAALGAEAGLVGVKVHLGVGDERVCGEAFPDRAATEGDDRQLLLSVTQAECEKACRGNYTCSAWEFHAEFNPQECWIKRPPAQAGVLRRNGTTSGNCFTSPSPSPPGPPPPVTHKCTSYPNSLATPGYGIFSAGGSLEYCQQLAASLPEVGAFEYRGDWGVPECFLKYPPAVGNAKAAGAFITSGTCFNTTTA